MLKYIAIFFILFFLYIILFIMDVRVVFEYVRNKHEEWAMIYFRVKNDILEFTYDIQLMENDKRKRRFRLQRGKKRKERINNENKKKLGFEDIYKKIWNAKIKYSETKEYIDYIVSYINKKEFNVEITADVLQGNGDAAQTGLICGLLWGAVGILDCLVSRYIRHYDKKVTIRPCFNKKTFEISVVCIFHVKIVHIIVVLMRIYYTKYRLRLKSKRTAGGEISG